MQRGQILIGHSFLNPFERIGDKKTILGRRVGIRVHVQKSRPVLAGWLSLS